MSDDEPDAMASILEHALRVCGDPGEAAIAMMQCTAMICAAQISGATDARKLARKAGRKFSDLVMSGVRRYREQAS